MGGAGVDLLMTLLLARTEAELERWGDREAKVLWLGPNPVPESVQLRAVPFPDDPPPAEGWLAIRRLGDELVGDHSVKQALEYQGVSLWWFVHYWMVYGDGLASWNERYRVLRRVLAATAAPPARMVLLGRRADDDLVARAVAAERGIPYRWAGPFLLSITSRLLLRWRAETMIRLRMAKLLLRGFLARLMRKNSLASRGPVDMLFNTSSSSWDARRGRERLLSPLLDGAERRGLSVVGLHLDYRRNLGLDTLRQLDRRIVAWESLVTPALAVRALLRGRGVARSFGRVFPGHVLGVPAARLLSDRLPVLFGARLADAVLAIETSRRALGVLRPRCLYVVDAYDLWGRGLVVAAREAAVRSVEVQHGIIRRNHGGYLHLEGEVAADHNQRSPYSPIPDLIVVHGVASKESLIEDGHFPPDSVRVTGSPNIESARRRQGDRHEIRSRLGLREDGLVLLFFGAPRHVVPADDEHVRAVLACCLRMPELQLVLRPHPSDHSNPDRYRSEASAAGIEAQVLTKADPFELVLASDIVVAHNSTTVIDAMALERPVIYINMSGTSDLFPFVEDGGALPARTEDQLGTAILALSSAEARLRQVRRHEAYANRSYARCADPVAAMLEVGFPQVVPA
jgi:CDP-Glycerol:Poly(glycerophosphate) glycerophosphotransferase